jgi:tetratricopeptide (TPR) repeat protein
MNSKPNQTTPLLKAQAYFKSGVVKSNLQDYEGAIADFNKATEIAPNYATPYYNRAFLKIRLQDNRGAIIDFNKAIALDPKDAIPYYYINVYHNRGNAKYRLKEYLSAVVDYSKAIALKPTFASAYYKRGLCKIELNKETEGCIDIFKATELGYIIRN